MTRIEKLRKIVAHRQHDKVDDILVDLYTASAILACYEVGSPRVKKIIENAPLTKVAQLAMKITKTQKDYGRSQ